MTDFPFIYAAVPKIACIGKCIKACGPIDAGAREKEHFERTSGKPFPDALKVLATRWADCPHLNPVGRCAVYQYRPLVCRLFGVVPEMPCPWGCKAERMLSENEATELMRQAL